MDAVIDEIFVRQAVPQSDERLYLIILKSIAGNGFDVGGENLGHRTCLPIIFNGLWMMQENPPACGNQVSTQEIALLRGEV
jgi:hypothetical protein